MKLPRKFFPHYARYETKIKSAPIEGTPKRIVIISDTHIAKGGIFNPEMFKKGIEEILRIKDVDYIIHLGDLTHDGTYLNYEYALDCIKPIRNEKFHIIPGNHDSRNVGHLLFEEFFGGRGFEIEDNDLYILGIDSSIPDLDPGRIGMRILEKVHEIFLNKPDKIKIFCFHHQLIPIPLTGRERSAIIDGGNTIQMILDSKVDLVLNGHRHISNVYSCTNGNGELVIFNSGTLSCNKTRYRELFTYTILEIFQKAVVFNTKKLYNDEIIERGRYINRVFSSNSTIAEKELILKLIHIANTHFSSGNFLEKKYKNAIKQINAINADLVIHSGDVTDSNKFTEFKDALVRLKEIKHPKVIIPGNNDLRTIGWEIFPKMIGPLEPYFENDKVRVLGINSVDMSLINGNIGRKRMQETVKLFKESPKNKINIVAFYHNLIPHPKTKFDSMLSDSGNVLKFFTDLESNIHFILTGNDHISFSLQVEDTIISSCGTLSSKDVLDLEGNTFNVINCYKNGAVEIEKYLIDTNQTELIGQYWIGNLSSE
ncbi:MAG TPA: metallophosphoesterase [Candidatus Deferrimicrobium sp.]|nr:metallophosphoesterase [Candidatus Deferrimicrobium sp.]